MPTPPLHNEKELLQQIAGGDRTAFQIIYNHYWNLVHGAALAFLKSPEWAQDIVQEVFLKLWMKRERLPAIEKFDSFLYIMTRNELVNALKRKFSSEQIPESYLDRLPGDILLPDHAAEINQLNALVAKAVDQLPPRQKLVYQLTREKGLSHEEIAGQLGTSVRTVSNQATKALNNIRLFLQAHGEYLVLLWLAS